MTSRIIDAKYHILLPGGDDVGGPFDRFQWVAVLRSASAREAYRRLGHSEVDGMLVARLLIFSQEFPRSLAFCLQALARHYQQATAETPKQRRAAAEQGVALLNLDGAGRAAGSTPGYLPGLSPTRYRCSGAFYPPGGAGAGRSASRC